MLLHLKSTRFWILFFLSLQFKQKQERWLPRWLSGKESASQCRSHRKHGFDPWVRKSPSLWESSDRVGWSDNVAASCPLHLSALPFAHPCTSPHVLYWSSLTGTYFSHVDFVIARNSWEAQGKILKQFCSNSEEKSSLVKQKSICEAN